MCFLDPDEAIKNHNWLFNPISPEYIHVRQYVESVKDIAVECLTNLKASYKNQKSYKY
jgi:hypothetical protein